MKYYNSFDNFKLLFPYYSTFFNLRDKEPVPIKLNEDTLKKLFNNLFSKSQLWKIKKSADCCVYRSYANVKCSPIQKGEYFSNEKKLKKFQIVKHHIRTNN